MDQAKGSMFLKEFSGEKISKWVKQKGVCS